jgi:hypothetical protein
VTSSAVRRLHLSQPLRWRTVLAASLLSASLAGCSSAAPDFGSDAAQQLQAKVLTVSQSAAGNDPTGALKSLDELVTQLDAAAAEGNVSFKRHQNIMKAIDAVRADLTAAKAQADVAAAETAAAAAAQASQAAVPPAVEAPAQGSPGPGKGQKGKGKEG